MSDRVSVAISEGIADIRLNRPEKMNALDPAMFQALYETGRSHSHESFANTCQVSQLLYLFLHW